MTEGDLDRAWRLARRLDPMPIDRALGLTMLLGQRADPRFERAARRFLARFVEEAEPALPQVSRVADALCTIRRVGDLPAMSHGAARALEDLGRQLRTLPR